MNEKTLSAFIDDRLQSAQDRYDYCRTAVQGRAEALSKSAKWGMGEAQRLRAFCDSLEMAATLVQEYQALRDAAPREMEDKTNG